MVNLPFRRSRPLLAFTFMVKVFLFIFQIAVAEVYVRKLYAIFVIGPETYASG